MNMKKLMWLLALLLVASLRQATAQCTLNVNVPDTLYLSCANPSASVTAQVTPPGGLYNYFWYGGGQVLGFTETIQVSQTGTFFVSVYDSLSGCNGLDTFVVSTDGSIPLTSISSEIAGCDGPNPQITLTAISNNQNNTYLWNNGINDSIITVGPGTYCVTVSNPSGCTASQCITVTLPPPLTAEIWYPNGQNCNDSLGMWVGVAGGQWPYSYVWNNGNTNNWYWPPIDPGYYSVTVTDVNGCSVVASYFVEPNPNECGLLEGTVFADFDNNCLLGAEQGLQGFTVLIENAAGDQIFAYTNNTGHYQAVLEPGDYGVSIVFNGTNNPWTPCQASYVVTVPPNGTVTQNLPLQADNPCPDLSVDVSIWLLRRCNNNNYYYVYYNNQGAAAAQNAYVEVSFDPFLSVLDAQIPYTSLGNNVYRFDLGNIGINDGGSFWIRVGVSCDAVLGQTHCVDAIIYPHDPCPSASPNWSGAGVELTADCSGGELRFHAKNPSAVNMTTQLNYVIIEDAILMMNSTGAPLSAGEDRIVFTTPANGSTWRIETNQEPFYPSQSLPSLSVEGCTTGQTFSTGFVNQFETDDADEWSDTDCRENVASFDPNDKQAFPTGYGAAHYIKRGVEIEYLIRFQNTGTDTAFTVVIRDTLSAALDPGSVVPGASSHPYRFDFYGDGALKFTFDNILLPDSNTNEAASHGFVSFRVSQRENLPLETIILNTADIYFDANEPVRTNTTFHRIGQNFVTVSTWTPFAEGIKLLVSPNPAFDHADLQLHGLENESEWQLNLLDATGKTIVRQTVNGANWRLERGSIPAGLYFLQVSQGGKLLGTAKLMVD